MASASDPLARIDPIILCVDGLRVEIENPEQAVERARAAWEHGGEMAAEWIGVHAALIDALESRDQGSLSSALQHFRNAACAAGWMDPQPVASAGDGETDVATPRDGAPDSDAGHKHP